MKISSKIFAATAMFLLFFSAQGAESEYSKNIQSYSYMMRIAKLVNPREKVRIFRLDGFSLVYESGKPAWNVEIEELIGLAKKNKINSMRIDIINFILKNIVGQAEAAKNFEDMEEVVDNVSNMAFRNSEDLIYAITAFNIMDYFLSEHKGMFTGESGRKYRKRAKANLKDSEDKLVDMVKTRYEDENLKKLVAEYKKLFPAEKLDFEQNPPTNIKEVNALFDKCLDSFFRLDKVSSMTDFKSWGYYMLTLLILDSNSLLVDEFNQQLKNYRNTFQ